MISVKRNSIMKTCLVVELVLMSFLIWSCEETMQRESVNKSLVNTELINTLNDMAMENAIVSQHTLYPYHFIKNSEQLNELGQRDLSILTEHFKKNPGHLNVRSDGTSENLYQARLTHVAEKLQQTGIDLGLVTVSDGMPGGRGMTCTEVLQIREADQNARNERRERHPEIRDRSSN